MLTLTVFWLALLDSINPATIAIAILLILGQDAWIGWAYISGVFITYWFQAIVLYFGLGELLYKILLQAVPYAKWILTLAGGGVIAYGLHYWRHVYEIPDIKKWRSLSSGRYTSYIKYIVLGSATTLAETPTAFFLVIAVVEVQKAGINDILALLYFSLYTAIYTLPIIALTATAALQEERLKSWFSGRLHSLYVRLNMASSITMVAFGILIWAVGVSMFIR